MPSLFHPYLDLLSLLQHTSAFIVIFTYSLHGTEARNTSDCSLIRSVLIRTFLFVIVTIRITRTMLFLLEHFICLLHSDAFAPQVFAPVILSLNNDLLMQTSHCSHTQSTDPHHTPFSASDTLSTPLILYTVQISFVATSFRHMQFRFLKHYSNINSQVCLSLIPLTFTHIYSQLISLPRNAKLKHHSALLPFRVYH